MANGNGRYWDIIVKVAVGLVLAGTLGLYAATQTNGDRLTSIEASRFTAQDGAQLQRDLAKALSEISQRLARIEANQER